MFLRNGNLFSLQGIYELVMAESVVFIPDNPLHNGDIVSVLFSSNYFLATFLRRHLS